MDHYIEGSDEDGFYSLPEWNTPNGEPFRLKNYELVNLVSLELEFGAPPENEPNMYFIDTDDDPYAHGFQVI